MVLKYEMWREVERSGEKWREVERSGEKWREVERNINLVNFILFSLILSSSLLPDSYKTLTIFIYHISYILIEIYKYFTL
jgi:hypothetical protein